ncbi:hypothetical protein H9W90_11350 [Polaribacter pectinis]|uniref:Transcription regulator BetR N-terminal domain-containing protein n=1 Tax=Polaribacter pectinis TaxID=2738844 RepID=A0A7G9L840_9FLAO|nr:hypothetical protein [Polaribacter pectinis]QNM84789.1 hypothetical protein H9W90_11350 [Polaribacter pectinis]
MLKVEERLFNFIQQKLPKNVSFIEEIADVLDVSYDAAYRRIKGKTAVTLSEILKLTKHYNFVISDVFSENKEVISVSKSGNVNSIEELKKYFDYVINETKEFSKFNDSDMLFAAKDLPFYYSSGLFRKFKMYTFLNVLAEDFKFEKLPFKDFDKENVLVSKIYELEKSYESIHTTEIWSENTLTSSINQILYFFKIKLLDKESALEICCDLRKVIKRIENQCVSEKRGNENKKYELFNNEILNLNNTVFFRAVKQKKLFIPFTTLSYLKISDEDTCNTIEKYFLKQLQFSKQLSGNAEIERTIFFNTLYERINMLKKQIELG